MFPHPTRPLNQHIPSMHLIRLNPRQPLSFTSTCPCHPTHDSLSIPAFAPASTTQSEAFAAVAETAHSSSGRSVQRFPVFATENFSFLRD